MNFAGKLLRKQNKHKMLSILVRAASEATRRVAVKNTPFTIGSDKTNELVINDSVIMPKHCRISDKNGVYNLTFIHDSKSQQLAGGERLSLGKYTLVFQIKQSDKALLSEPKKVIEKKMLVKPAPVKKSPVNKNVQYFALQKHLHKELLENLDLKHMDVDNFSAKDLKQKSDKTLREIISKLEPSQFKNINVEHLIRDVIDQALGLGPLEELLKDEAVSEIMVNNFDQIYVENKGKLELSGAQFIDNYQVIEVIRRIIAPLGRRIDESTPMVDARLQDGSRVNAIIPPLAISGPTITIRKFASEPFGIEDLINFDSLTPQMGEFLSVCVAQRKNICISGGTGSGKTTLLGVIGAFIPDDERIVTIEDAAELKLPQEHVVSLESKPANIEGKGAITIQKLVINSLRMRPDRIIVGECRGGEALDMLQAMNTGHDGSLTTLHANTCRDAVSRLQTMVMMAGMNLPSKAIVEQISSAIDIIVQTTRLSDGTRRIISICVVDGMEGDKITLQEVFEFKQKGYDQDGKVIGEYIADGGIPSFYMELQERGIKVDTSIFR